MILICPQCGGRYHVDSELVGPGRHVRCVSCDAQWFQKPIVFSGPEKPPRKQLPSPISSSLLPPPWYRRIFLWSVLLGFAVMGAVYWKSFQRVWHQAGGASYLFRHPPIEPSEIFRLCHEKAKFVESSSNLQKIHITGEINNLSNHIQPLPPLYISLWSIGASPAHILLATQKHQFEQSHLLPRGTVSFQLTLKNTDPLVQLVSLALKKSEQNPETAIPVSKKRKAFKGHHSYDIAAEGAGNP